MADQFLATFFAELGRGSWIEQAVAVARADLQAEYRYEWWQPVLYAPEMPKRLPSSEALLSQG